MTPIRPLFNPADAERVFERSRANTVVIYKHSPICSVSDAAIEEFQAFADALESSAELYSVDVLDARPASRKIEELTGVRHESPQVLILADGKCVWHASHGGVRATALDASLRAAQSRQG